MYDEAMLNDGEREERSVHCPECGRPWRGLCEFCAESFAHAHGLEELCRCGRPALVEVEDGSMCLRCLHDSHECAGCALCLPEVCA